MNYKKINITFATITCEAKHAMLTLITKVISKQIPNWRQSTHLEAIAINFFQYQMFF